MKHLLKAIVVLLGSALFAIGFIVGVIYALNLFHYPVLTTRIYLAVGGLVTALAGLGLMYLVMDKDIAKTFRDLDEKLKKLLA